jgi:outer membrane protein assembly factor BamB
LPPLDRARCSRRAAFIAARSSAVNPVSEVCAPFATGFFGAIGRPTFASCLTYWFRASRREWVEGRGQRIHVACESGVVGRVGPDADLRSPLRGMKVGSVFLKAGRTSPGEMRTAGLLSTLVVAVPLLLLTIPCGPLAGPATAAPIHSGSAGAASTSSALPAAGDWPTYLENSARSSANSVDRTLNASNAANLTQIWKVRTNGSIAASPIVVRGVVYVGSWDGHEYALNESTGARLWSTYLGKSLQPACRPPALGITSSATWNRGTLYVGGGGDFWYALNAKNGSVLWKVFTGNNSRYYDWGSPLIVDNHAFIGIASYCDNPLVRGELMDVSLSSHAILHKFYTVPSGQVGGGIWGSPTYDVRSNSIFFATGNGGMANQTLAPALVSLNASTLAFQSAWKVPNHQRGVDSDFGATPTLIVGAHGARLVVVSNKNGIAYAFDRSNLGAGPVWTVRIADGGPCPQCGSGDISSGAFNGDTLYLAGPNATIKGRNYAGSVDAVSPATGHFLWRYGTSGYVLAAVSYNNGLVVAGSGSTLLVFDAVRGVPILNFTTGGVIFGPAAIANGCIFFGSTDFNAYALGLPGSTCDT